MLFTSADITECNHEDIEGKSGLTYSIVGEQHRKQCKYCGLDVKENHKGADCECGYRSDTCTIWFNDESGHSSLTVARGKEFELPDYGGLVMSGDSIPPNLYRIKGWKLDGDTSGRIYEQGEIVAADADMSFVSDRERMYRIEFDEVPHGSIRTNMTDRVTYAAEGETISFGVETDPGYSVSKVTYKIMQGYETDSTHDVIYHYSDPVQISPVDGKYQLTMPEMTSTGGADNNRMIITAECEESKAVTVEGVTGSFNDKIKLNYYLNIPDDVRADENACVKITNENTGKGVTLPVGDAVFDEEKGGYKFSIPLAAKEASDTITAKVLDGSGGAITLIGKKSGKDYTGAGVPYTLMQYFDWLKKNGKEDEKPLGAAAQDYCASAQIYFEYNADDVSVSSEVQAVTAETLSRYIADREGSLPGGVSIKGISAMLESDNTLRLYYEFKGDDPTGFTFKIDGHETELKQRSDGMRYLALDEGVYSNKLQDTHTYTVSDGTAGGTYTITASVLTYARSCANKSKESESNLGKALYLYNRAAVAAFGE